jgi:ubiquinone/menaquinone biosynthesis C-methylase UbiE
VAIDTAHTLLRHARADDTEGAYVRAGGATLPFPDKCFDVAVAYNSLQVVDDMHGTVQEIGRTLDSGGCFCACIAHPVTDLGRFAGEDSDTSFTMRQNYFDTRRVEDTVQLDGLSVTLRGWTYTLEQYVLAMEHTHLQVAAVREPRPTGAVARYQRWREVPLFLFFRAVKP